MARSTSLGISELDVPKDGLECSRGDEGEEVELRQLDEDFAHVVLLVSRDQDEVKRRSEGSRRGARAKGF